LKTCAYQCNTDDDCKMDGEPTQTHFCNPTSKRCEDSSACATSPDCVSFASQWYPCTGDLDCYGTDVCVTFGGRGVCATPPAPDCSVAPLTPDGVPTSMARFGSAGNVEVCASPDDVCVDKTCQPSCTSQNGTCSGTTCNTTTGLCGCSSTSQCTTQAIAGKPTCGANSLCGCATSDQCAGAGAGADHCYSGTCGCSGTAACPASLFNNAPPVCE
jgi:hypothetical protein